MRSVVSLENVIDGLRQDSLISDEQVAQAGRFIEGLRAVQPWYVRAMVGFGAWLASLLLIGFVGGFSVAVGGVILVGLTLIGAAVWLRRQSDHDFAVQATLAASLAGQGLFVWGVADLLPGDVVKLGCVVVLVVSTTLFFAFPDRIHRVLMVLFAMTALTVLIYAFKLNAIIPVLGPFVALALALVYRNRAVLSAGGQGHLLRPLENGLMLSAFGLLLLSTIYVLPELRTGFVFYPRPWISSILLGVLFLWVGHRTWTDLLEGRRATATLVVYGSMLAVVAAAWAMPGLLLALIVILLGAETSHRSFIGAGIVFLAIFVGAYFYGIEVPMLTKSITLVASGVAVLIARWLLRWLLLGGAGAPAHG